MQEIKRAFNQQKIVLAVFVDFCRAYDSIWRAKLIEKLKNMNIEGNMLVWFSRFLDQRWTKVTYGKTFSKYKQTKVGLPQGAVTSTTLFNAYINNLPNIARNTKTNIGTYADDVIWASIKNNAKHKMLEHTINTALNSLSKWATENNMEINASKIVYQFFSMRHKNDSCDLKINSQKLPKSESTKYLDVYLDNKLSWKNHVEHTINKVNLRLRLIKRLTGATWGSTQETMNTTYKTYVKPLMKYGSEVLITASDSTLQALETTQNNALRIITRGVKTIPILALQLYTGHLPTTCEIKQQAAVSLTKIKALPQTTWATKTLEQQHLKTQMLPLAT